MSAGAAVAVGVLGPEELAGVDAWWRAINYLTVAQIHLRANPLLRRPLEVDDIKPRLLGHWAPARGWPSCTPTRPGWSGARANP